jgi:gluconolactonase
MLALARLRPVCLLLSGVLIVLSWNGVSSAVEKRSAKKAVRAKKADDAKKALMAEEKHPLPATVAPGAKLETEYEAPGYTLEGPVWDLQTKKLYFTAFGKTTQILRLDERGKATVWLDKTGGVNGTCMGIDGRLIGAAAYDHKIVSYGIGTNGPTDTKVLYEDKKLFQPNDVCQAPNGNIYFTDPDWAQSKRSAVYLLTPKGKVQAVVHDAKLTNGVRTSLDGKTLYVSDDGPENWRAYPIQEDGTVGPGHVFFDPPTAVKGSPDGMGLDEHGNLYVSGRGGVWAADKHGKSLGFIAIPEFCSYASFGGEDGKTLYFVTQASGGKPSHVYSLRMTVRGEQWARKRS